MKKIIKKAPITFALFAISSLLITACSSPTESNNSDDGSGNSAEALPVMTEGKLTVCISKNAYQPMYWNDNGTLTGFDVDSITAIADALDLEVTFSEMAFDGLLPALISGRCDVLRTGLYLNEERASKADAIPYLVTGPTLIIPAGNPLGLKTTDDLSGARIAAQAASANEKILRGISDELEAAGKPGIDLSVYPELPETIAALQNGRVDATIETDVAATQAVATLGEKYEVLSTLFPAETNFGMFLPKDSDLTPYVLDTAVALTEDGTFAALAEKYGLLPERIVDPRG